MANLARYLDAQPVIGINPATAEYPGVLVRYTPTQAAELMRMAATRRVAIEPRTMAAASLDDGQRIVCLNEVFVGHASHQSARYRIRCNGQDERQSSSGLIVTTGTGATGWASSIHTATRSTLSLPAPTDRVLAFFVREPWTSAATGGDIREGTLTAETQITVTSEMDDHGVIFGDGIEHDYLPFGYGRTVTIEPARRALNLVAA